MALSIIPLIACAEERVIIEAGPGVVQISDEDGQPEPVTPGANPATSFSIPAEQGATQIQRPTDRPTPKSALTMPPVSPPAPSSADSERGEKAPQLRDLEVAKMKELGKLRKEIGVSESATESKIVYEADQIFDKESDSITPSAKPSLEKLTNYMRMSERNKVTLSYLYAPDSGSKTRAQNRLIMLIAYFTEEAGIEDHDFTMADPEPLEQPLVEDGVVETAVSEYKPLVVITMQ
ncbi:MAG: hypothetical protein P1U68_05520 [Verrucomicrobiales bacterium]|nr:hypothetical protein [Verrucomicrobiales bacterium]